jgi:hypothetical protein
MAANGYIGKISAIVTANTSELSKKLKGSSKDVENFGAKLNRSVASAAKSATRSLEGIFTPLQRLQRQLQVGLQGNILKEKDVSRVQLLAQSVREIVNPAKQAATEFDKLSTVVAAGFTPALVKAQTQVEKLQATIDRTGQANEQTYERTRLSVERTTQAVARLTEAQKQAASLASGRELRFTNPGLVAENARALEIQRRAAALSPSQIQSGGIADLVARQSQASEEAARLQANLENARLTGGRTTDRERAVEAQVEAYRRLNEQIEQQIANLTRAASASQRAADNEIALLQNRERTAREIETQRAARARAAARDASSLLVVDQRESNLISREGESTDVSSRLAIARAVEEEAAFRQRAADAAEREAAAVERLSRSQNRLLAAEIDRTSGAAARRNASAFDAATGDLLRPDDRRRREFGVQQRTRESELERSRALERQFLALPDADRAALEGQRRGVQAFINSVESGGVSVGLFTERLDALEQGMAAVEDRAARIRDASRLLVIDQDTTRQNDLLNANEGARTDLGDRLAQAGRSRIERLTGNVNLDSTPTPGVFNQQAQRDIDALATRVGAVRQQLETLPNSVRTRFIPELQRAQAQLVRLQNAPLATAEAIENAARRVERLEASARRAQAALNFRQSFGGAGLRGIEEGLNQQALQGYNAQLQLLQQTLAGTSQAARGPAVAAFNNLRNAIANAMERGTLETAQTRREIQRLTDEAVRATAAAAGIGAGGLGRRLRRVGDIGRGAFGNLGLGVQQAVFAVDDFFSVTGGLDQRIRAAGNNISQLGFVLGGTAGLIGGVAVSIGAQLVVALINWANAGRTTEDQVKSLNDALARQKSLVEELAQAFASLGDSIARKAFSAPAQEARDFRRELEQIRAKQEELRDQRSFSLDEGVLRARADVSVAERRLQGASTRDAAVDAQRQLAAARARLADEENRVRNRPELTPQNVRDSADSVFRERARESAREAGFRAQRAAAATGDGTDAASAFQAAFNAELQRFAEIRERAAASLAGIDDPTAQINALRGLQQSPGVRGDERLVAQLEQLIDSIERNAVRRAGDELVIKILEASNQAAGDISAAQARVAAAIEAGVPAATTLQIALDKVAEEVDASQRRIAKAQQDFAASSQSPADVARRDAEVNAAKAQIDAARANAEATIEQSRAIDIARQAIDRFAEALNRASQEAQSNLQQAQQRADETRRQDLGRSTPATRQAREQADADLRRQQELASGVEQEVAASRERFGQRVRETQEVRRRGELAAEARSRSREASRRVAAAGIDVPATFEGMSAAARAAGNEDLARFVEETRDLVERARESLGLGNENLWAGVQEAIDAYQAVVNDAATETERALARIAEIDAQLGSVGVLAPGRREELVRERAALEQQAVELDADVRRARDESTREAEQASAAERGRQLSMTPGERAAEDLNRGLEDIRQFFGRQAEEGTGLVDFDGQRKAQRRLIEESQRSIAPAIFSLFDSVRNAVAAGPSRAALTASDISTSEGARELNRLIRGDDAARDVNLIELQEQTRLLRELVEKTDPAVVAN